MIADYLKEKVHEDYQKFMVEIDNQDAENDEFQVSKFHILNAMIGLKFGLFPFLDKNGYKSKNVLYHYDRTESDRKNVLECKHYDLFRYDYKGLDVLIHRRSKMISVFVLYNKLGNLPLEQEEKKRWDFIDRFGYIEPEERKSWEVTSWSELYERNERYTNLSFEELAKVSESLYGYNFFCFDIIPNGIAGDYVAKHVEFLNFLRDDFGELNIKDSKMAMKTLKKKYESVINTIDSDLSENSKKLAKLFKTQLDKCLDEIINKKNPILSARAMEYFDIKSYVNLTNPNCTVKSGWTREVFDLSVDFGYTK